MTISRLTPCQYFEIFNPRYRDKTVLLACHKVGQHNEIKFIKAKHLKEGSYYVSGDVARNSPQDTNGTISVYAVPLDKLEPLERI